MKISKKSLYFNSIFFISLILILVNLKIYERTIIRFEIIGFFYLIGVLTFFVLINKLKNISPWNNFNNFIFCISVIGSFLSFLLLGFNYFFSSNKINTENYRIQEKKEVMLPKYNRSKKSPLAVIDINNSFTKEIKFGRDQIENWKKANFVELDLSNGLFNFQIIRNKKLK
ncbi:hypothetical protein [Sphingobacterium litopenaei]|uniref:Uncharacterized protein n=1 Tax=Sphingobacterium litopenaei TaxID=2763500 RepID=A0ABR7YCM1_9SPHI|nr:hypothetical protein [Sphingobacterium litopenaei]MBD1428953.1 hypothetical protein [Sphingobacterium litopenaei]